MARVVDVDPQLALLTSDIRQTDLAYCAGLFDGEGSITIRNAQANQDLRIEIANSHKPTIEWLKRTFGGFIYEDRHPENIRNWQWRLHGLRAVRVLRAIEPHLRIKKEEAIIAIEFQPYIPGSRWHRPSLQEKQRRERLSQQLKQAKERRVERKNNG